MGETVVGGVYLNPDGKTYHDAWGKEVKGDVVADAKKIQAEQSERNLATLTPLPSQSNEALAQALKMVIAPQAQQPRAPQTPSPSVAPLVETNTSELAAETERRGRRNS